MFIKLIVAMGSVILFAEDCVLYDKSIEILENLVRFHSITPDDHGCQNYIQRELESSGFVAHDFSFNDVTNTLYLRKANIVEDIHPEYLLFVGHTDVVPAGEGWSSDPFKLLIKDDKIFGRGVVDMKGGIACFIAAVKHFIKNNSDINLTIGILLTSDEEGIAQDGVKYAMQQMHSLNYPNPNYCLIGEPTGIFNSIDNAHIGRRGSIHLRGKLYGQQGHVAHPESFINPIHLAIARLSEIIQYEWHKDMEPLAGFPETSGNIVNFSTDFIAENVVPAEINFHINWRFSPPVTANKIKQEVEAKLNNLKHELTWHISATPYHSELGKLNDALHKAFFRLGLPAPRLDASGGVSDGRYIAPYCSEIIELGLMRQHAHQIDECTTKSDLNNLAHVYYEVIKAIAEK